MGGVLLDNIYFLFLNFMSVQIADIEETQDFIKNNFISGAIIKNPFTGQIIKKKCKNLCVFFLLLQTKRWNMNS